MPSTVPEAKRTLRDQIRTALKRMSASERVAASLSACALLRSRDAWTGARSILFFAPLPQELDIWPLLPEALSAGKQVFLPRFSPLKQCYEACRITNAASDVQVGGFGIREAGPAAPKEESGRVDLTLVPGVAFDLQGRRLGRGKGFYDRLLSELKGTRCGVAFDEQIVEQIPVETHDMHLDCLLTPTRWLEVRGKESR